MKRTSAGFTLIEILIAILIAAIGVLGIAGLQAFTLKSTHGSNLRSIATRQAYELADSMRANQGAVNAGHYNNQQGTQVNACYQTAGCTEQQMAQMDVYLWNQSNAAALPGGRGFICTDSTPNDGTPTSPTCDNSPSAPYVIKLWWDERDGSGQLQRFVFTFRP
ncbi:MAG TPA: type IV pilus modification protein PilV [Vicinamibacterales bacterium]|nr:type IV pilus modification protein PilV [Vicinamibacterales bacterium]